MMEAIRCSETSVFTGATRHHIPEDGFLEHVMLFRYFPVTANVNLLGLMVVVGTLC
jgi:hypothetical protein